MITVLVFIISGVIGSLFIPGEKDDINYAFSVFVGICVGSSIGLVFACIIGFFLPIEWKEIKEEEEILAAFKNSKTVRGSFFLGFGYIDSELYYAYYRERDDGGCEYDRVSVDDAVIYEYDKKSKMAYPRLEIYEKTFTKEIYHLFGIPGCDTQYKFFVPKGTVVRNFSLDLE